MMASRAGIIGQRVDCVDGSEDGGQVWDPWKSGRRTESTTMQLEHGWPADPDACLCCFNVACPLVGTLACTVPASTTAHRFRASFLVCESTAETSSFTSGRSRCPLGDESLDFLRHPSMQLQYAAGGDWRRRPPARLAHHNHYHPQQPPHTAPSAVGRHCKTNLHGAKSPRPCPPPRLPYRAIAPAAMEADVELDDRHTALGTIRPLCSAAIAALHLDCR